MGVKKTTCLGVKYARYTAVESYVKPLGPLTLQHVKKTKKLTIVTWEVSPFKPNSVNQGKKKGEGGFSYHGVGLYGNMAF